MSLATPDCRGAAIFDVASTPVSSKVIFWLISAIVLASIALQIHLGVNPDTSWNITLAEKVLDGERPNIDFFEINPPMSYFIYVAPTLAAMSARVGRRPPDAAQHQFRRPKEPYYARPSHTLRVEGHH